MKRTKSNGSLWIIIALVNLLLLTYPIGMLINDTPEATMMDLIILCGVALVLTVGDLITIMLTLSTSY